MSRGARKLFDAPPVSQISLARCRFKLLLAGRVALPGAALAYFPDPLAYTKLERLRKTPSASLAADGIKRVNGISPPGSLEQYDMGGLELRSDRQRYEPTG